MMVTIVKNNILYTWNLVRVDFKGSHYKKWVLLFTACYFKQDMFNISFLITLSKLVPQC